LLQRSKGVSGLMLWARIRSKPEGYTPHEFEEGLNAMVHEGLIACTDGVWWLR
jgi:hypothetical protein